MVVDLAKSKNVLLTDFQSVLDFLKTDVEAKRLVPLVPEIVKLIRIVLCMLVSTCTAERSFSCLRRLKTYLRSTMSQERLNHAAILCCHKDVVETLYFPSMINEFIKKNPIRMKTFALYDE